MMAGREMTIGTEPSDRSQFIGGLLSRFCLLFVNRTPPDLTPGEEFGLKRKGRDRRGNEEGK